MSKTIVSQMHDAKILLTNVQQPDLAALIAPYGYDETRIAEGQSLYDNASILLDAQQSNYANQYLSTQAKNNYYKHLYNTQARRAAHRKKPRRGAYRKRTRRAAHRN